MSTQGEAQPAAREPKPADEFAELVATLAKIDPQQSKRAIQLLADNVERQVWDVALLYLRTCAETRG